jgi:hypothetical protein
VLEGRASSDPSPDSDFISDDVPDAQPDGFPVPDASSNGSSNASSDTSSDGDSDRSMVRWANNDELCFGLRSAWSHVRGPSDNYPGGDGSNRGKPEHAPHGHRPCS